MLKAVKANFHSAMNTYLKWFNRYEYNRQVFQRYTERPIEYGWVFRKLTEIYPKTIVDVGTGTTALPSLLRTSGFVVTALDNIEGYWPRGMFNQHYHVVQDDITDSSIQETFDVVLCISVLEHIPPHNEALAGMFKLMKPDGHLLMSFPYNENHYIPNSYELPGSAYGKDYPFVTQMYSRKELNDWLEANEGLIVEQEYWRVWTGEFWTQGEHVVPPVKTTVDQPHHLTTLHIRRKGAAQD